MGHLIFRDADEVVDTLKLLGSTPRKERTRIEKLAGFSSLLDGYEKATASNSAEQLKHNLAKRGEILSMSQAHEAIDKNVVNQKFRSPFAAITNERGELQVGNTLYNVLSPEGFHALVSTMPNPYPQTTDPETGYKYVDTAMWWKASCSHAPCSPLVVLPGYSTHYFEIKSEVSIGKADIVIQLWKGWLPKAGLFPGGTGAEVGVYYRDWPASELPLKVSQWWPYSEQLWLEGIKCDVKFELINPENGNLFFQADNQRTWWKTRWMLDESYEQYRKSQSAVPDRTNKYWLMYTINGKERKWKGTS